GGSRRFCAEWPPHPALSPVAHWGGVFCVIRHNLLNGQSSVSLPPCGGGRQKKPAPVSPMGGGEEKHSLPIGRVRGQGAPNPWKADKTGSTAPRLRQPGGDDPPDLGEAGPRAVLGEVAGGVPL